MLFGFIALAAAAAFCYAAFASKKTLQRTLLELYYECWFQAVGAAAIADDHLQRKRNRLPEKLPDASGKTAVITGGARGIGLEVVKVLLDCNMFVVMGVRDPSAAERALHAHKNKANLVAYELDVSSLKSVERFAERVRSAHSEVHVLVNNAGVMFGDFKLTDDGFENQLATNYLGHFALTHRLMPALKRAAGATCSRVVNVSSCAHHAAEIFFDDINMKHTREYVAKAAYAQSKLAQIMFARHLNARLESEGANVKCYSVHPGVVDTDLFVNTPIAKHAGWLMRRVFKTPEQGAVSVLHACLSPKLEGRGGLYVSNCRQGVTNAYSKDQEQQRALFALTCSMLDIKEAQFGVV